MNIAQLMGLVESAQRDGGPDTKPLVDAFLRLIRSAIIADAVARPPSARYYALMTEHGYTSEQARDLRDIVWRYDT